MSGDTSIGPDDPTPQKGDAADQAITEGVDAQAANEYDMRHGLAGAEAKPFATFRGAPAPDEPSDAKSQGLVKRPATAVPPSGQQGAGADHASEQNSLSERSPRTGRQ